MTDWSSWPFRYSVYTIQRPSGDASGSVVTPAESDVSCRSPVPSERTVKTAPRVCESLV